MKLFFLRSFLVCSTSLLMTQANAIEISSDYAKHQSNLQVGLGSASKGLFVAGNWTHSSDDGRLLGLGVGYNIELGSFGISPEVKLIYTDPHNGHKGYTSAFGGSAKYQMNRDFSVYADYYYGPGRGNKPNSYQELGAGVGYRPISLLGISAGYKKIEIVNSDSEKRNVLVNGPYLGFSVYF